MKEIGLTLLKIFAVTAVLLVVINFALRFYTQHGDFQDVPNIQGKLLNEGIDILDDNDLGYIIVDSIYDASLPPSTIIDQNPVKGTHVKANRKIYITINATNPPNIKLPKMADMSLRQAKLVLENWGLVLGKQIYVPDIAKDAVLSVQIKGKDVKPGIQIPKGTVIDLVLGDGFGMASIELPDLRGLMLMEAISVLDAVNLKVGSINAESDITDSLNAYVYFQTPEAGSGAVVGPGDAINLYITQEIPVNIATQKIN